MNIKDKKSENILDVKYINSFSFEDRIKRSSSLLQKYPDKIPVILEKSTNDKYLPKMNKTKLLVADTMTISAVLKLIKTNLNINESTSIYIIVPDKNIMLSGAQSITSIYQEYKNKDGFLYLEYCTENVFG
jgi:GABA(A) receptor-associated protein